MAGKHQFDLRAVRKAIAGSGGNIKLVADKVGCSRGTIYRYLKKYPELKKVFEAEDASVDERPHYRKEKFEKAIGESNGIVQAVADRAGVSRGTVVNALKRWPELNELLKEARESLVDKAESVVVTTLGSEDEKTAFQAAKYVTGTLGKNRGWASRTELTGPDGEMLFAIPQDVIMALQVINIDVDVMLGQFFDLVRQKAALVEG